MGHKTNGNGHNSKTKSQRKRWLRKLAQTNQKLQELTDADPSDREFSLYTKHRKDYASRLGMNLDEASRVLPS